MGSQMVFFIARLLIVPIVLIIPIMFIVLLFKIFFSTKKNAEQLEEIKQTQKQILRELRPKPPVSTPEAKTVQTPPPIAHVQAIKTAYIAELPKVTPDSSPAKTNYQPAVVLKPQIKSETVPASPSQFEEKASAMVNKIWSWLIVGEGHRMKGISTEYAVATTWLVRVGHRVGLCFIYKRNRRCVQSYSPRKSKCNCHRRCRSNHQPISGRRLQRHARLIHTQRCSADCITTI